MNERSPRFLAVPEHALPVRSSYHRAMRGWYQVTGILREPVIRHGPSRGVMLLPQLLGAE